jgi:hypothetical protein
MAAEVKNKDFRSAPSKNEKPPMTAKDTFTDDPNSYNITIGAMKQSGKDLRKGRGNPEVLRSKGVV